MSSFRSAFVALALAGIMTTIGCAEGGLDSTAKDYCVGVLFTSPSCITNTPSPSGTTLTVPTGEIRPKMDGDSKDFVAVVELVTLSPSAGVIQNGRFPFRRMIRFRVDDLNQRGGSGINYWVYTSNDGVNKISEIANGFINTPNLDVFDSDGKEFRMVDPFKHILVEMKTVIYGQGEVWAKPVQFDVGYSQ